ncbi:MAG: hypothetical protein NUW22_13570 [Acidobacteria bacterium]|nr:hypothetical protein [Acidobacteriota bacterium]
MTFRFYSRREGPQSLGYRWWTLKVWKWGIKVGPGVFMIAPGSAGIYVLNGLVGVELISDALMAARAEPEKFPRAARRRATRGH